MRTAAEVGARSQGRAWAPSGPRISRWSRPSWPPDPDVTLRNRIIGLLRGRQCGRAGRGHWSDLRTSVGGRVGQERFRSIVDGLIADGLVVEVFEARIGRQQPFHLLILADAWDRLSVGEVVEIRGPDEIVRSIEQQQVSDGDPT